jgi:hypothetical protein
MRPVALHRALPIGGGSGHPSNRAVAVSWQQVYDRTTVAVANLGITGHQCQQRELVTDQGVKFATSAGRRWWPTSQVPAIAHLYHTPASFKWLQMSSTAQIQQCGLASVSPGSPTQPVPVDALVCDSRGSGEGREHPGVMHAHEPPPGYDFMPAAAWAVDP